MRGVVVVSDGVWQNLSQQSICEILSRHLKERDANTASKEIVDASISSSLTKVNVALRKETTLH